MKKTALFALTLALGEVHGYWRLSCSNIQAGRLDAIINPGTVSPHSHTISGAMNFNVSSTYDSLSAAFCTSCTIQDDKSAYWTPQLYYQTKSGQYKSVRNDGTVVYYLGRGENVDKTVPFPKGFRMVSGDPFIRAYDNTTMTYGNAQNPPRPVADRVSFVCLGANYQNGTQTVGMSYTNCPNGLRAQIQFPSCWNGKDLYNSTGGHVAYLSQIDNGVCPPTHQVRIPHLFYELYYFPNEIDTSDGGQFVWAQGDPTGYGFHGDFINGWNLDTLQNGISQCLVGNTDGGVDTCAPFQASNDPYTTTNCPLQPLYFNEQVKGTLTSLPGCNPVQPGPTRATPVACSISPGVNPLPPSLDGKKRTIPTVNVTKVATTSGNFTYQGCFGEPSNGRALSSASTTSANMTTAICAAFCQNAGYPVFGTEYSQECYCGSALPAKTAPQKNCSMACSGDLLQYCGGPGALSVWRFDGNYTGPTAPASVTIGSAVYKYQKCISEGSSGRALPDAATSSDSMTVESCVQFCNKGGYSYAGVEYGRECYCNNAGPANGAGPASDGETGCNVQCAGNKQEICGGGNRLGLYKLQTGSSRVKR